MLILISYFQVVFSQAHRAVIRGRVTDATQLAVSGAEVRLFHRATNESRLTASGNDGEFIFVSLMPGRYRLEIEQPVYRQYSQDLDLFVNQELRTNVALEVETLHHEPVIVNALLTPLRRDSAAVGTVIEKPPDRGPAARWSKLP